MRLSLIILCSYLLLSNRCGEDMRLLRFVFGGWNYIIGNISANVLRRQLKVDNAEMRAEIELIGIVTTITS